VVRQEAIGQVEEQPVEEKTPELSTISQFLRARDSPKREPAAPSNERTAVSTRRPTA
jgi:hypothetical protein